MTKLSILIPTCNRSHYIKYAIQSCLNIKDQDIEILVSENHSSDNTYATITKFRDARLKIYQPPNPLPMHENFEFLLQKAKGTWVTFLGDDDAILPHCVKYLESLSTRYPMVEALCAERAYYTWSNYDFDGDEPIASLRVYGYEEMRDSKQQLNKCLTGKFPYIDLPGMYSGGFHKKSLIDRIYQLQGGTYFRCVTPDAYSALMGVLHTFRYLETGLPLTYVGTSPVRQRKDQGFSKNRHEEFIGRLGKESVQFNASLAPGKAGFVHWPFPMFFLDAYLSAAPFTNIEWMSNQNIYNVYIHSIKTLLSNGRQTCVEILSSALGYPLPTEAELERATLAHGRVHRDKIIYDKHLSGQKDAKNILSSTELAFTAYHSFKTHLEIND